MYDYAYDACMIPKKYEMTCHAQKCLMNHALSPKCAQQFEDKERKKTHF